LVVGGAPISLDSIEHKVLRKMGEPRVHFAIVCASHSCPRLLNEAYTTERLEEQLVSNTRVFFANPENFQFDPGSGQFRLSAIIDWFGEDFGAQTANQLKYLAPYFPSSESQRAAAQGVGRVSFLDYDWNLNDHTSAGSGSAARTAPAQQR
jgi:hypothetical protein